MRHATEPIEWVDMPSMATSEDVMEFDAETCAAGTKRFLRRISSAERRVAPYYFNASAALIEEVAPGMRVRQFVHGHPLPAN